MEGFAIVFLVGGSSIVFPLLAIHRKPFATVDGCENHFAPPSEKPWNDSIALSIPTNNGFNWWFVRWCEIEFVHIHSLISKNNKVKSINSERQHMDDMSGK